MKNEQRAPSVQLGGALTKTEVDATSAQQVTSEASAYAKHARQEKSRRPTARLVCSALLCLPAPMEHAQHARMVPHQTMVEQSVQLALLGLLAPAGSAPGAALAHSRAQTAQHARHVQQDTLALVAYVLYAQRANSQTKLRWYANPAPMALPGQTAHAQRAVVAPSQTTTKQLASRVHLDGLATLVYAASVLLGPSLRKND